MTALLQRAVVEIEQLPAEDRDAVAARLLAEVDDHRQWDTRFVSTADGRWDRLAEEVRREVAGGGTLPLADVFPPDDRRA